MVYILTIIFPLLELIFNTTIDLPWSIEKWMGIPFIPWSHFGKKFNFPWGVIEGLFMFIFWPFKIKTSFIGLFKPIEMWGMTPFVIYTNSTTIR